MALQNSSIWNMQTFLGGIYHIPDYQREYSWEEDEIGDFWADLESTRNDPDKQIHFFGQVVVHSDEEDNKKYIIDGQQRTITSVIFLRALQLCYEKIYSESKNDDANDRFSDIRSLYIGRNTKASPLHLVLNALDADYFREHIQLGTPEPKAKEKKKSHDRLRKAFVFFAAKLEKVLSEYKPEDVEEKIECLDDYYNAFTQRFNLLYMEATKLEEAFVIFETLNARGKDLETSDLLKNYIFSQSKDVSLSQKRWNSMVSTLDKADPTRYIRHYWNSCHDFARDKELYRTISKEVATPKSSKELLNTLEKLAPYYHAMSFPGDDVAFQDSKLISTLKALKVLKAKSFYPVILAMKQADADFSESQIASVAKAIETYVFRNQTICGKVANQSERFFASLAKQIYDGTLDTTDDICRSIHNQCVTDEEFSSSFSIWTPAKSEKEIVRYVLTKIHKLLDHTLELNLDTSEVHIEHIMPVNGSQWDISEEDHDAYLWRLGNLMLLSGPMNISISNRPFNVKRLDYQLSKIEPNKDVALYAQWGVDEIKDRQQKLCTYAVKIWEK